MYVRVKRRKTTFFLRCEPSETVQDLKQKLEALSGQPAEDQRLFLASTAEMLDDSRNLAKQKIHNDAVLALAYRLKDSYDWEPINVETMLEGGDMEK